MRPLRRPGVGEDGAARRPRRARALPRAADRGPRAARALLQDAAHRQAAVAERRVTALHERGVEGAYLYGAGDAPDEQLAGGLGAFFLLTEKPERYGLPANADSPVQENVVPATLAAMGAGLLAAAGVAAAFLWEKAR